jgi:hypothetical protein
MKPIREKRESIIHAQNVFLTSPVNIVLNRETGKYYIGYEPKYYRVHFLCYKISRELISKVENSTRISTAVDINVREDYRYRIKKTDQSQDQLMKNVTIRIVPTRYSQLKPIYGMIFMFRWRKTGAGGLDQIEYKVSECPKISNSSTINTVCYKKIANQVSGYGTHGTHTYIILSPETGRYKIGEWIKMSNVSKSGRQYVYIDPITVSL